MGMVCRCICSNITFKEVQKLAKLYNLSSVEELREQGICSRHCNLCAPYIKRMFKTGETEFTPMPMDESGKN